MARAQNREIKKIELDCSELCSFRRFTGVLVGKLRIDLRCGLYTNFDGEGEPGASSYTHFLDPDQRIFDTPQTRDWTLSFN